MANLEMLTENISIDITLFDLKGNDEALSGIAGGLLGKIAHTGLKFDDVTPKVNFEVTVPLADSKEGIGKGITYEAALADALKDQKKGSGNIKVGITGNIEVPYFLEQVRGRGLSENAALEGLVQSTRTAKDKYGARIVTDRPENAKYIVQLTSADYSSSKVAIPDTIGKKALLGRGDSHESIADALAFAEKDKIKDYKTKDKSVVSIVYEVRQNLKVYGVLAGTVQSKPAAPYVAPAAAQAKPYVPSAAQAKPAAAKPAAPSKPYVSRPSAPAAAAVAASAAPSYAHARTRGRGSTAGSSPGYVPSPMKMA